MKSILKSCKPKILANILNGDATVLIVKKFPKDYVGWIYLYCDKGRGKQGLAKNHKGEYKLIGTYYSHWWLNSKVVARFYCDKVEEIEEYYDTDAREIFNFTNSLNDKELLEKSCLTNEELNYYFKDKEDDIVGYAIHISEVKIFDKPKEIWEFKPYSGCWYDDHNMCKRTACPYFVKEYEEAFCNKEDSTLRKAPQNFCYLEV